MRAERGSPLERGRDGGARLAGFDRVGRRVGEVASRRRRRGLASAPALLAALGLPCAASAAELARVAVFHPAEVGLRGPALRGSDNPTLTVEVELEFTHEGGVRHRVAGFWDGGESWRVRFSPTRPGRWSVTELRANRSFSGARVGDHVTAVAGSHPGFWVHGAGRWFGRSDGSHPYLVGNTFYDFLFAPRGREASAATIRRDVLDAAPFFNKLRFCLQSPRNENRGALKPFLVGETPSDTETDQPNPAFFRERVDVAVAQAFALDVVADLVLGGTVGAQVATRPGFLRYVAARYGAYPNVWFTIGQEWNEKVSAAHQRDIGARLRALLPYPSPISTHGTGAWDPALNGAWATHSIRQLKADSLRQAATAMIRDHASNGGKPTVNDENGYDPGEATTAEVVEGITGTFLGGGYGTTGHKAASKEGGYFWGHAALGQTIAQHPSAAPLGFLRTRVDRHVRLARLAPLALPDSPFSGTTGEAAVLAWPGEQYVLGTDAGGSVQVRLPAGRWRVLQLDVERQSERELAEVMGSAQIALPVGRAILTVFTRRDGAADRAPEQVPVPVEPVPDTPAPDEPPPPQPNRVPIVTTISEHLSPGVVGQPYDDDLEADGGDPPLRWSATGLPPGLSVQPGGQLAGIPTEAGRFRLEVVVTDDDGDSARATLELEVRGAAEPGTGRPAGNQDANGPLPPAAESDDPSGAPQAEGRPVRGSAGCATAGHRARPGVVGALAWLLVALQGRRRAGGQGPARKPARRRLTID